MFGGISLVCSRWPRGSGFSDQSFLPLWCDCNFFIFTQGVFVFSSCQPRLILGNQFGWVFGGVFRGLPDIITCVALCSVLALVMVPVVRIGVVIALFVLCVFVCTSKRAPLCTVRCFFSFGGGQTPF